MESIQSKLSVSAMTAYFGIFKGELDVRENILSLTEKCMFIIALYVYYLLSYVTCT